MEVDIFFVLAIIAAILMSACCAVSYGLLMLRLYRRRARRRRIREEQRRQESFKTYDVFCGMFESQKPGNPELIELDLGNGLREIRERPW